MLFFFFHPRLHRLWRHKAPLHTQKHTHTHKHTHTLTTPPFPHVQMWIFTSVVNYCQHGPWFFPLAGGCQNLFWQLCFWYSYVHGILITSCFIFHVSPSLSCHRDLQWCLFYNVAPRYWLFPFFHHTAFPFFLKCFPRGMLFSPGYNRTMHGALQTRTACLFDNYFVFYSFPRSAAGVQVETMPLQMKSADTVWSRTSDFYMYFLFIYLMVSVWLPTIELLPWKRNNPIQGFSSMAQCKETVNTHCEVVCGSSNMLYSIVLHFWVHCLIL